MLKHCYRKPFVMVHRRVCRNEWLLANPSLSCVAKKVAVADSVCNKQPSYEKFKVNVMMQSRQAPWLKFKNHETDSGNDEAFINTKIYLAVRIAQMVHCGACNLPLLLLKSN